MAKTTNLYVTQTIKNPNRQITPADTTTALQLQVAGVAYTVGADGGLLKALTITSTDSAAKNVQIIINDGTNDRVIGTIAVPAMSGTDGTVVAIDGLAITSIPALMFDQNDKPFLPLAGGAIVKVKAVATLTVAKAIDIFAVIEEY